MRRSLHFVPGGNERMLAKALTLPADGLILDLEDAVTPDRKAATRPIVRRWLETRDFGSRERWVRMNPIYSEYGETDLEETIAGRPHGYVVPKPRHAGDIRRIAAVLERLEQRHRLPWGSTRLVLIATETPEGLLNIREVAGASPRITAVSWGIEDLSAAMGLPRTRDAEGRYLDIPRYARVMCAVAAAAAGALLEPTLLRPFYKRAEEYQLLVTFGLLMIIDDVIRFLWGPYPLSASVLFENFGSVSLGESIYPTYNFLVIAVGGLAAVFLWAFIYKTRFGVVLRATSQDMRMASALGVNVNRVYVQAFTLGCFMAGLGGAIIVPSQSAVLGMGVDALILAFIVVVIGGLGSLEGALVGALIVGVVREMGITWFPEVELAVLYLIAALVLLVRPAGIFGRP